MTGLVNHWQKTSSYPSYVLARNLRGLIASSLFTMLVFTLLSVFLLPFAYMAVTAVKSPEQISAGDVLPLSPSTFTYEGEALPLYNVPGTDGVMHQWALLQGRRNDSTFIDPAHPENGEIAWEGRWRTLEPVKTLDPQWGNFQVASEGINFPRLLGNTIIIAVTGMIGTIISCSLVAYGFSRFPIPGKSVLFLILVSTIILPPIVTLVPTYIVFAKIGWTGTWLPLIVPHFFANAYNVFLLRQFFLTIPRDLDEAAMIDGANPFQIFLRIIMPQSLPAVVVVGLTHIVFAWNDFFNPFIYLLGQEDKWPISIGIQQYNYIFGTQPNMVQAISLLGLSLPVILFFLAQRVFMQGVVITGVEK
jgi:multiple sugar transport system permease protein